MPICVEQCASMSGKHLTISSNTAMSCTITPSTPISFKNASCSRIAVSSFSNTMVFIVT